jgi:peptidoglycan/LPS O-acetylase OafA/YrhL
VTFLVIAAISATINSIKESWDEDFFRTVAAVCGFLIGVLLISISLYNKTFSEEIISAQMADYRLVEIIQSGGNLEK